MDHSTRIEHAIHYVTNMSPPFPPKLPTLLPSLLSEREAMNYYHGIPSQPVLVARTSTHLWNGQSDEDASSTAVLKELQPVGDHPLKDVWEDNLAFKIHKTLEDHKVHWTSTDVVRLRDLNEEGDLGPVILWIGVKPTSLSGYDGLNVAINCRAVLLDYGINDVHVEIRESAVTRFGAPSESFQFLPVGDPFDRFSYLRTRLTTTLGVPLCATEASRSEGTGGFFFTAGAKSDRILLATARHAIFPLNEHYRNTHYERTNIYQPKYPIAAMSFYAYVNSHMHDLDTALGQRSLALKALDARLQDVSPDSVERHRLDEELARTRADTDKLCKIYDELDVWTTSFERVFGHVILSPPLQYGPASGNDQDHEGFTSDWAVIEIDPTCIETDTFYGNVIDLSAASATELSQKLGSDFVYPDDRQFKLGGTLSGADIRRGQSDPDSRNLIVLKNGGGTGLTVGQANDVCSYTQSTYFPATPFPYTDTSSLEPFASHKSKEWAILPFDSSSGSFALRGDSGSVVATSDGRIGGIITGGSGTTQVTSNPWGIQIPKPFASDITYATPIHFLLRQMDQAGLKNLCLNPVLKSPTTD